MEKHCTQITCINDGLKYLSLIVVCTSLIFKTAEGQISENEGGLNLVDSGRRIENSIRIFTSGSTYRTVQNSKGQKLNLKTTDLIINGDTLIPQKIKIRGQTSLYYRRKSYSFNLDSKADFFHGENKESFRKFYTISLSMDRDYINNRLAFEMMEKTHQFHLYYTFCELRINEQSEGIYMVVERPQDWALKKKESPLIIRRGYNERSDKKEASAGIPRDTIKKYSGCFRKIYSSLDKYKGEELYQVLSQWINLEDYMKWIAFNFFVRNSDYTDEVFFYIDPDNYKFNFIPWDYDDLFSSEPHEGFTESRRLLGDNLIFSTEDLLDKKIAEDEFLYKAYLVQLKELLNQLSPAVLKKIFEKTFEELYPYYSNEGIISLSKYDQFMNADMERLKKDMISLYKMLIITRDQYLKTIEGKI